MTIVYSNTEAALLQAGSLSRKLKHRYEHAATELIEPGATAEALRERAGEHEAMIARLDKLVQAKELLPREADLEVEDLQKLADRFRKWLDAEAANHLLQKFAEDEQELAEELETARQDHEVGSTLDQHLEATRRAVSRLPGLG